MTTTHTPPAPAVPVDATPGVFARVDALPRWIPTVYVTERDLEFSRMEQLIVEKDRRIEELERTVCRLLHELDGD